MKEQTEAREKVIVILGPTASGKSDLAVKMAREIDGEVISADSRQVYKGLDIGTGKITKGEMGGIRHHLLDVTDPQKRFSIIEWRYLAVKAIVDIISRNKIPIIAGGTGFYISALIDGTEFPDIEIDEAEQRQLENEMADDLFAKLSALDLRRAKDMKNNGDLKNKRRLIRAILIAQKLGSVPIPNKDFEPKYDTIYIGTALPDDILKKRIHDRLIARLDIGMIDEARTLHEAPDGKSLSYERMDELGLEYRYLSQLLQGKIDKETLIQTLSTKIWQYARRQKTWFKRNKDINWIDPSSPEDIEKAISEARAFIKKPQAESSLG